MSRFRPIGDKPPLREIVSQSFITIGITLVSAFIFSLAGIFLARLLFNIDIMGLASPSFDNLGQQEINAFKLLQFFNSIGVFLVPAFILPVIFGIRPERFLGLQQGAPAAKFGWMLVLFGVMSPLMEWLIQLNQQLELPTALNALESWMREQEEKALLLTEAFIKMEGPGDFFINLIVMVVLAAVAEELFFRGLIQRLIYHWFRNIHVAVIITAILFSALHLQFFGFLPRMFLGLILGYVLYWTGSIWLPVFGHLLNNFTVLMVAWLNQRGHIDMDINEPMDYPYFTVIISLLLTALVVFFLSRQASRKKPTRKDQPDWRKVYTTADRHKAEIVTGVLENEGIPAVVMNKRDSSYTSFGEIDVYVPPGQVDAARQIIESKEL